MVNDKVLHLLTFFALTLAFYWVVDTTRRRTFNLTLAVCTLGLGVGSEFLQAVLPNGRSFDFFDVVANIVGSLAGLALCSWYHKRMLERRRLRRYRAVSTAGNGDRDRDGVVVGAAEGDLELGEGPGIVGAAGGHEEGVTAVGTTGPGDGQRTTTLEEEVDNWDENAVDAWDDGDDSGDAAAAAAPGKGAEAGGSQGAAKKHSD